MKNKSIILLLFLVITFFAQSGFSQDKAVKFQFSILDETGKFVSGLKTSDIQILQNKKPLKLDSIESKAELPLEVVILIDASASQERMLPFEKTFAENIIENVLTEGKDKAAIIKFSGEPFLVQDLTNDLSKAKEQIKSIKFDPPSGYIGSGVMTSRFPPNSKNIAKGSTSIWDSLEDVMKAFPDVKDSNSNQLVILISDGVNTFGESKLQNVILSSLTKRVPIYAVGIGDKYYSGADKQTLKKLTEQTSGVLVLPNEKGKDLPKQIEILKNSLRANYEATLTVNQVKSQNPLQELRVEIINPELRKRKLQIIQPKGFVLSEK